MSANNAADIYSQYSYKNYLANGNTGQKTTKKRHIVFITTLLILLVVITGSICALYFRGFDFRSILKGNAKEEYKTPQIKFYTVEIQGINKKTDAVAKSYEMIKTNGAGYLHKQSVMETQNTDGQNSGQNTGEPNNGQGESGSESWTLIDSVYLTSADAARRMAELAAGGSETDTVLNKYTVPSKAVPENVYNAIMTAFNKLTEERTNENIDFIAANLYLELKKIKTDDVEINYLLNQCVLALYNLSYKAINTENAITSIIFSLYNF